VAGRASGVKIGMTEVGRYISPDGVAPSRMVGVSASVIFTSTIKVQKKFSFLLAPAHPGSPGKKAVNGCGGGVATYHMQTETDITVK